MSLIFFFCRINIPCKPADGNIQIKLVFMLNKNLIILIVYYK